MADAKPLATFTRKHPQTQETQTRDAYSPDEVVNLTADGWVAKPAKSGSSASTSSGPTGGKPANN